MKKIYLLLFLLILFQFVFVSAQTPQIIDQNDSIVQGVQKLQEFTEEERWNFIGEKWKEQFLKNKFVSDADQFFKKINFVFVFLLAKDYTLSPILFFSFLFWLITFVICKKYFIFLKDEWMQYVASFAFSVALSHMQIFNSLSSLLFRVTLYKPEWWWKTLSYIIIIVGVLAYYLFLKYFGKIIEAQKKKKKDKQAELDKKELNIITGELRDAAKKKLESEY